MCFVWHHGADYLVMAGVDEDMDERGRRQNVCLMLSWIPLHIRMDPERKRTLGILLVYIYMALIYFVVPSFTLCLSTQVYPPNARCVRPSQRSPQRTAAIHQE